MRFDKELAPGQGGILRLLGYGDTPPDETTARHLEEAGRAVAKAAAPRWVWRTFPLAPGDVSHGGLGGVPLPGGDIATHLAGCHAAILLAVTLGRGVDDAIRAGAAADVMDGVLRDHAASVLAEQYADEAERLLCEEAAARGEYLTGRFSPGYGDFPLDTQAPLLRLLDAPRAIGLSCGTGGLLLPGKSITAVLGVAGQPVQGRRAGCKSCAMAGRCRAASVAKDE